MPNRVTDTPKTTVRILLVEDNPDDAALIQHHLQEAGLTSNIETVDRCDAFCEQLKKPWDIILCDYTLPGFSPHAALQRMQERDIQTPLLIISGDLSQSQAASLMLEGARDFIDKQDLSRLLPAIQREMDVTRLLRERLKIENHIAHLTYFDEDTSLPNGSYFNQKLELLTREKAADTYIIAHISLNELSMIRDVHGAECFNSIVRETAQRMHQLGDESLFARIGKNDFALLINNNRECNGCSDRAEGIYHSFTEPFYHNNREHILTPTIGISCYPCHDKSASQLLRNARCAMQHAGRHQQPLQAYTKEIEAQHLERLLIYDRLKIAAKHNEFHLHYQPKIQTLSGEVTAFEVLIRWHDSQLGDISPARFIPIAEETGDIVAIGEWVLREACNQARIWRNNGIFNGRIAVNLSMRQLRDSDFPQRVERILLETEMPPQQLELEITETDIMHDSELSISLLQQLKDLGIWLVIDDFGTGYSSLSYLKRLPISSLKIDRAFIADIDNSKDSLAIVQAIMALAESLQLSVVAEGVETKSQLDLLTSLACDEAQGYYISRPIDASATELFIGANQAEEKAGA